METVKPLTWEEAQELWKDAVYWIDGAEYNVDEKKLLDVINTHASSRVRALEEELDRVKAENASLKERLEAAEKDTIEFVHFLIEREYIKRYRDYNENNERPSIEKHLQEYNSLKP